MEHLALEIFDLNGTGSKYANLPEDTVITITDTSEIFASGDVWSYPFTLNVHANAHIFGTSGDIHGSMMHEQIDHRRARLWVEGVVVAFGYLKLGSEAQVSGNGDVDVTLESGQKTFDDMIDGVKANQVPMMNDVQIGYALKRTRKSTVHMKMNLVLHTLHDNLEGAMSDGPEADSVTFNLDGDVEAIQEFPRMMFPKSDAVNITTYTTDSKSYTNTDLPYTEDEDGTPTNPFCNVALCYQRYSYEKKDVTGRIERNYDSDPEAQRGYDYMPANRVNSAPNFFVLYWLRCLMEHLSIHIDENQMMGVEDLRRLFFVNTNCEYEERKDYKYVLGNRDSLLAEQIYPQDIGFTGVNEVELGVKHIDIDIQTRYLQPVPEGLQEEFDRIVNEKKRVLGYDVVATDTVLKTGQKIEYYDNNNKMEAAYASKNCFPNVDIKEVIQTIEDAFGVRFLFSNDYRQVRIVMMRNIFRSQETQIINCEVIGADVKMENNIRGFRMTFGKKEDTEFYYKGFADKLPHKKQLWPDDSDKHDYSQWDLDEVYSNVIKNVTAFNKTCYVTPVNGNAYGVKVDKHAKGADQLHPALFEYAGYMDAEDGDCTGEEDTIKTINLSFTPAIMNDLNMETEKKGSTEQRFALFVSEQMAPRRDQAYIDNNNPYLYDVEEMLDSAPTNKDGIVKLGEFAVRTSVHVAKQNVRCQTIGNLVYVGRVESEEWGEESVYNNITYTISNLNIEGYIFDGYRMYLQDNFVPNDDGIAPIEKHDWGLTLGIMRGSGSDARVDYKYDHRDEEGNKTWDIVPGSSATSHPDICDNYGNTFRYTGDHVVNTAGEAIYWMPILFPKSNLNLTHSGGSLRNSQNRIGHLPVRQVTNSIGNPIDLLFGVPMDGQYVSTAFDEYAKQFNGMTKENMYTYDKAHMNALIEVGSSAERKSLLDLLQKRAFLWNESVDWPISFNDDGAYDRISLKLRAEKPNPYYDPKQPEDPMTNPRYLAIEKPELRGRGLADKFYKEYSFWLRNARIVKRSVRMPLAQLLAIDKTKRVTVGDLTGFVRKIQYSVSNKTGLGNVTMEIMYI